jgi:hypothetical protein
LTRLLPVGAHRIAEGLLLSFYKPLSFPTRKNEREDKRHVASFPARVQQLRCPPYEVTVTDVSIGGCRLICGGLSQGDEVWIIFRDLSPVRGRIAWVEGREAGCEFHVPLRNGDLRKVLLHRFGSAVEARPQKTDYVAAATGSVTSTGSKLRILGVARPK